jgi:hypothetical protein
MRCVNLSGDRCCRATANVPAIVLIRFQASSEWRLQMGAFKRFFGSRRSPPETAIDGGLVLDRLEIRLGAPLRGEARLILASQLEIAVQRIRTSQSLSTAALTAQREGARIAAMLPRSFAASLQPILADELVRGHAGTARS